MDDWTPVDDHRSPHNRSPIDDNRSPHDRSSIDHDPFLDNRTPVNNDSLANDRQSDDRLSLDDNSLADQGSPVNRERVTDQGPTIEKAEFVVVIEIHRCRRNRSKGYKCGDCCNCSEMLVHGTPSSDSSRHPTMNVGLPRRFLVAVKKRSRRLHPVFRLMNKVKRQESPLAFNDF
jgi:hypothetical protein